MLLISFAYAGTDTCQECGHVVATHEYTFEVDEDFQEYTMDCDLCGHGEIEVSILPDDPREKQLYWGTEDWRWILSCYV